jgi:hypothetical protein
MQFTITSDDILWLCGFAISVWGVIKIWKEIKQPNEDKTKMLLAHEEKLEKIDERLKEIESAVRLNLQSSLVTINHDITGNGIDQLKNARNEIQEYLINK